MTAPIASGFPDWGRYQAQATKIYANSSFTGAVAQVNVSLGYVGDISQLGAYILIGAGTTELRFNFFADAALSLPLASHFMDMRTLDKLARTVPVLGPFCQVTFIPSTTPVDATYRFFQAAGPFNPLDNSSRANVLFSAEPLNVPVGNTFVDCNKIWPGRATLMARLPGVVSSVTVYGQVASGGFIFLASVFGNGVEAYREFYLPATHIALQFSNGGPGAQNFTASLMVDVLGS